MTGNGIKQGSLGHGATATDAADGSAVEPLASDSWQSLKAPFRGDGLAGAVLVVAAVVVGLVLSALTNADVISWTSATPALVILNTLSLGLTVVAFAWSFLKDWRWLHAEEVDVKGLLTRGEVQADPLLILRTGHRLEGERRVETLLDDRIRRTLLTKNGASPVRESELRAVANWRSASLGSFARYTSGLLLLMTVLGTFLGVKASLGPLKDALLQSTGSGTSATAAALAAPLGNVAAAFGSNLTALVGSIGLGLAAWGLTLGRQNMLARLEQGSSLYVYPKAKARGGADQMAAVAPQIKAAGEAMSAAASQIGSMRETIDDRLSAMGDPITDLSASIEDSLKQTRQMLKAVLEQQAVQLADNNQRAVTKIERQITDTTTAVQQATVIYGSIIGRLQSDVDTIGTASVTLAEAIGELKEARKTFGTFAEKASLTIDERLRAVEELGRRQLSIAEMTDKRYHEMNTNLTGLVDNIAIVARGLGEAEEARRKDLTQFGDRAAQRIQTQLQPAIESLGVAVTDLRSSLADLPAQVSDSVHEGSLKAIARADEIRQAELLDLQERAAERAEAKLKPSIDALTNAASALVEAAKTGRERPEMLAAVNRLTAVLNTIEQRESLPMWRRMLGRAKRRQP